MGEPPEPGPRDLKKIVEAANVRDVRDTEKSGRDWHVIMRDDGGKLAAFTDEAYRRIENFTDEDWKKGFENTKTNSRNFDVSVAKAVHYSETDVPAQRFFPPLRYFWDQFPLAQIAPRVRSVYVPPHMQRALLGAAALLDNVTKAALWDAPEGTGEYRNTSLDKPSAQAVTFDNVQTVVNVASLVCRFVQSLQELVDFLPRLLQVCPNDEVDIAGVQKEVNPWGFTYLELFASAPFGFLATSIQVKQPETYEGARIVRLDNSERPIDPKFIYAMARAPLPAGTHDREKRHGRCPALHPDFRKLNLINRLGRIYVRALNEFLRLDKSPAA